MVGAQAITGAFRTVATAVAEAEASIQTVQDRHTEAATRLWVNIRPFPKTHPLARSKYKSTRRFVSANAENRHGNGKDSYLVYRLEEERRKKAQRLTASLCFLGVGQRRGSI